MQFCVVGLNHHRAPIDLREKVHFKETQIIEASDRLQERGLLEVVILSTCNRSELYFLAKEEGAPEMVVSFLEEFFQVHLPEEVLDVLVDEEALMHLFQVSMGLDSLVVGEDQILGQVRDAHLTAMEIGASGKILNKLFREAITFAKKIRATTDLTEQPVSVAYLGVKQIEKTLGDLKDKRVMIVGLGHMGRLALSYVLERGAKAYICNRTYENSLKVQAQHPDLEIIPFSEMTSSLKEMDILISATSSPHTVLGVGDLERRKSPLYIMDLSVPRDIDPLVAEAFDVVLYDVDSLSDLAKEHLSHRRHILESHLDEVTALVKEMKVWIEQTKLDPILQSMSERCDRIADDTLAYISRKTNLTHSEQMKVEKILRSALKKVMREPLLQVQKMEDAEKREMLIKALEEVL